MATFIKNKRLPKGLSFLLFACLFLMTGPIWGQQLYISRYVPGNIGESDDPIHRVELFNASEVQTLDVGGYIIMTRHYAVALPGGTEIKPVSSIKLGKTGETPEVDIAFTRIPGFGVRTSLSRENGDFIILFDRAGRLLDAFYYAPQKEVGFLPARGSLMVPPGERLRLSAPGENDARWGYIENVSDPAVAYYRVRGEWISGSRTQNLQPATQFQGLQARFVRGAVQLTWDTRFERDCFRHQVERSLDAERFSPVGTVKAAGNSDISESYSFLDQTIASGVTFYYRIRHVDKFGEQTYSKVVQVQANELSGQPTFDLIPSEVEGGPSVDVRFASQIDQTVRVQLLDEEFRELAMLYYGEVEAHRQHLVTYNRPLIIGKYYVIVSTTQGRYYETFVVR